MTLKPVLLLLPLLAACDTAPTMQGSVPEVTTTARYADGYPAGSLEDFRVNVGDRTFFDYDEVNLSNNAKGTLARQAAWLLQRPTLRIVIEGHADERGTREYNLALGEHRAAAVRDYLVALGLPAARLSTVSYGSERPAIPGSNEAAWSQNRRAVTVPQYTEIQ